MFSKETIRFLFHFGSGYYTYTVINSHKTLIKLVYVFRHNDGCFICYSTLVDGGLNKRPRSWVNRFMYMYITGDIYKLEKTFWTWEWVDKRRAFRHHTVHVLTYWVRPTLEAKDGQQFDKYILELCGKPVVDLHVAWWFLTFVKIWLHPRGPNVPWCIEQMPSNGMNWILYVTHLNPTPSLSGKNITIELPLIGRCRPVSLFTM